MKRFETTCDVCGKNIEHDRDEVAMAKFELGYPTIPYSWHTESERCHKSYDNSHMDICRKCCEKLHLIVMEPCPPKPKPAPEPTPDDAIEATVAPEDNGGF